MLTLNVLFDPQQTDFSDLSLTSLIYVYNKGHKTNQKNCSGHVTYFSYIKRLLRTTDIYIGKEMARELDNLIDKFHHVICCIFSLNVAICKKIIALAWKIYM